MGKDNFKSHFSIIELQSSVFLTKKSRSLLIISIASFEVIDSGCVIVSINSSSMSLVLKSIEINDVRLNFFEQDFLIEVFMVFIFFQFISREN
ncbi:hypothetical protein BpHYR1_002623 [Brachionus plicatilis]|uniref:Uncharacterized protein n=1 Tax=Brachionus plicatilis TaxID=10195 RepID=A0A3M7SED8_BRAPC|nr:hypothetical protein BpHYR1_002623 [Brachionus plicatilis]